VAIDLFDPSYYAYENPELAAAGIDSDEELRDHFQEYGLQENRQFSPFVDLDYYRNKYPDFAAAGLTTTAQLLAHLETYGIQENRQFSPFVDWQYYRNLYPDLAAAVLTETAQLLEHLQTYGVAENRRFSPLVDLDFYRNSYSDLQNFSSEQLFQHLQDFGLQEGRWFSPVVDLDLYLSSYPDLQQAFGNDREKLLQHLEIYGISESRTFADGLSLNNYLTLNPDVSAAVGGSPEGALDHLVRYGINEKRAGVPRRLAASNWQIQDTFVIVASNTDPNGFFGSDETDALAAFDVQGNFIDFFNKYSGSDNPQNGITGMVWGPNGNILVNSSNGNQVLQYDPLTGEYLGVFGDASQQASGLAAAAGLTVGPDKNVYVSSLGTEQVLKYDGLTGEFLGVFVDGSTDNVSEYFTANAFGPDGNFYLGVIPPVGDPTLDASEVRVYSGQTGQLLGAITGLDFAAALDFGPDGNLYVSDDITSVVDQNFNAVAPGQSGKILVYNTAGTLLRSWDVGVGNAGNISFGPDGLLYLSNPFSGSSTVTRYAPETGENRGVFAQVPAVTGELGRPTRALFLYAEEYF